MKGYRRCPRCFREKDTADVDERSRDNSELLWVTKEVQSFPTMARRQRWWCFLTRIADNGVVYKRILHQALDTSHIDVGLSQPGHNTR